MSADLEQLQLAFAYHMARELVGADANIDPSELAWVRQTFPASRLREAGLIDVSGRTTALFDEASHQALVELPDRLASHEKLKLVELVARASAADGVLAPEEVDAIAAVSRMLGVPDEQWRSFLDGLLASGVLKRDATGW